MPTFTLTETEFQQLVNVVANAPVPWVVSNPLLVKLGQQSQAHASAYAAMERDSGRAVPRGNSEEPHYGTTPAPD